MSRRSPLRPAWMLAAGLLLFAGRLCAQAGLGQDQIELTGSLARFHGITIDKANRSIAFPVTLNLAEGALEYLLVTEAGKTHESLLSTKVHPEDLQVAMLLLGLKPVQPAPGSKGEPPAQINREYLRHAPPLAGPNVDLFLTWHDQQGGDRRVRAEALVFNTDAKARMADGAWIYNGSSIYGGRFLAQVDGSIAALVRDSAALINNPRPGNDNDQIWQPNPKLVPPPGTPIDFTIRLEDKP